MNTIDRSQILDGVGRFEDRYKAFLETISTLRPSLHRYCARMTGSVMDGEDVVQEALFEAYRKLDQFDDTRPLKPWLFRIAHNRCVDFLRKRGEGVHHLCFAVPRIEEALARVREAGLGVIGEAPRPGAGGCRVAFLHPGGTGGVLVELSEAPSGS